MMRFSEAVGFALGDQTQVKTLHWQDLVPFEATMALKKSTAGQKLRTRLLIFVAPTFRRCGKTVK